MERTTTRRNRLTRPMIRFLVLILPPPRRWRDFQPWFFGLKFLGFFSLIIPSYHLLVNG
jgi:hypothetical protein